MPGMSLNPIKGSIGLTKNNYQAYGKTLIYRAWD